MKTINQFGTATEGRKGTRCGRHDDIDLSGPERPRPARPPTRQPGLRLGPRLIETN
jgi:hypothetical protein